MNVMSAVIALSFSLMLVACGTDAPSTQEQLDLVVTTYQPDYQFQQATTFVLPDKVVVISDPGTTPEEVDPALSQFVLDDIKGQLTARGYTLLPTDSTEEPSLFVEVSKMTTITTQVYYDYWYSYYGAYYAPYYGSTYGVGWAPVPVPYVTSATLGSLLINVTDPNNPNSAEQTIPTVWAAILNGVIDGASQAAIQQRLDVGIQQGFDQSPYFKRNGS